MANKKTITLDPGHGQYGNQSPNNTKYIEGTQMWHLANKLKAALEAYGFEVVTTRPKISDDPALVARGSTAGKNGSCMFLSLHSNAPGPNADGTYSKTVTGTTVYYSLTREENKTLADALGNKVAEIMGHHYRGGKTRQYPDKPGVDYYGVLRGAAQSGCTCALIVEHGFHTNVKDSNFLLDDANLQKLAEAEAAVIAEYFGQAKEPEKEPEPAGVLYRVQIGAYSVKANAEAQLAKAKAAGFKDAFITSTGRPAAAEPVTTLKVGDKVKLTSNATVYGRTTRFSSWVYDATLYVREVNGARVVISVEKTGAVTGAVSKAHLVHV